MGNLKKSLELSKLERVKKIMTNYSNTRDDLDALVLQYSYNYPDGISISEISMVVRYRALVEKNCPELRGTTYEARQKKGGAMKTEIIDMSESLTRKSFDEEREIRRRKLLSDDQIRKELENYKKPSILDRFLNFFK